MKRLFLVALSIPLALAAVRLSLPPWVAVGLVLAGLAAASNLAGDATEDLAVHMGPRIGGLTTAVLGGTAEFTVLALALAAGHLPFVKAAIAGCIVANLLVVLGLSATLGGLRHGTQYFDREAAGIAATMMMLSLIALAVPALYGQLVPMRNAGAVESLSVAVAGVMLGVYALSVYYSLFWNIEEQAIAGVHRDQARHGPAAAAARFAVAAASILALGLLLVRSLPVLEASSSSRYLLGFAAILLPIATTVAEHLPAVASAWVNRMDVSVAIATGSSMRIALLLAPLLVLLSLMLGTPMDLIFTQIELAAVAGAALVTALVALDGQSNWIEGAMLLAVYTIFGLALLWWPA